MVPRHAHDTIIVAGLGDLGRKVVEALARLPVGRVVAAGRDEERARGVAGQAALVAALSGGAARVEHAVIDIDDVAATGQALARLEPSVIVAAASRHTWWKTPPAAQALPYGAWLPLQVGLVRDVVRARDAAGVRAPVVALPYPDAVGPVLAPLGLAPDVGAGNVAEIAAKLRVLAGARADVRLEDVVVRLIAHHAVERVAFSAFAELAGADGGTPGLPPSRADVVVAGRPLDPDEVRELLVSAYPLAGGRETHGLTAAATATTVAALLADEPTPIHVPAPAGRPGGYPVLASRSGVALDLPDGCTEDDAIAVNAAAARWDGIERVCPDGTILFTSALSAAAEATIGMRLERVAPDDLDAVAGELEARLAAAATRPG